VRTVIGDTLRPKAFAVSVAAPYQGSVMRCGLTSIFSPSASAIAAPSSILDNFRRPTRAQISDGYPRSRQHRDMEVLVISIVISISPRR
jgi:hypothetical protein